MMIMMATAFLENHFFSRNKFPFQEAWARVWGACSSPTRRRRVAAVVHRKCTWNFSTCAATRCARSSGVSLCHKWCGKTAARTLKAAGPWWILSYQLCRTFVSGRDAAASSSPLLPVTLIQQLSVAPHESLWEKQRSHVFYHKTWPQQVCKSIQILPIIYQN